ncbi:alkaline phosphatase [Bacteroidia bacterium]|nr:alkaline phosphatase [Bacteroidia bacterium]
MKKIILLFFLLACSWTLQAEPVQNDSLSLIQKVEQWYEANMNYYSITVLMAIESSFLPLPSEIVVPPAAYVASSPDSRLNMYLIVLFATLGSIIGACVNYFLAFWLGRPVIYKFADSKVGHLFLLNREKLQKAEDYFNKHGNISTFIGRLIPVVRHLISIPAGLSRMNLFSFAFYTIVGAGIWNIILVILGYAAHGQADLINRYSHEIGWGVAGIAVIVILYWIIRKKKKQ